MNGLSRRRYMVGISIALAGLAGCSESPVESNDDNENGGLASSREQIIDDRNEVSEDEYSFYSFDLNRQATLEYEYTVRNGPEIDIFVLDDSEFDEFQAGNRFRTYSHSSGAGGSESVTLGEDSYRVVIDNTAAGDAEPPTNFDDDVAEVEIDAWVEG